MAASGWAPCRLGELIEIKHGWPFKSERFNEELTGKPIVISVGNFRYTGGFRFAETSVKEYRSSYPKEYELAPHDILLVMTCQTAGGEILGIPARVPDDGRVYLHNQRLGKVVIRDRVRVDPAYLYWLFLSAEFNRELVTSASGTKILHTAPSRIEAFNFHLPPIEEQRAIARILGTLDDKIELNRRMNETREAMARALFKSWFVDFDPIRAKAEGRNPGMPQPLADLFPDRFEDSALGEIPEGWQLCAFSEVCDTIFSGGTPSTTRPDYWGGVIPWLSSGETRSKFIVATEKTITDKGVTNSSTRLARAGATVIASAGQGYTRGQTSMLMFDSYINQSVVVLQADPRYMSDAYLFFDLERRYEQFRQVSDAHSSRGSLTTKLLADLRLIVPPRTLIEVFDKIVIPIVLKIAGALGESRTLAALRDTLLPKLISGELWVKDAERFIGRVS